MRTQYMELPIDQIELDYQITEPFVDAHYSVGTDEISFSADYLGNIELKDLSI